MTTFNSVKDSGERQEFSTGSVRDTRNGKGRFDLLDPISLARIAKHYENGSLKYGDWNWSKGQPVMRFIDSAMRHLNKLMELKIKGKPMDEDHLAAACWNIMAVMHVEEMVRCGILPTDLIDYPEPMPKLEGRQYNDFRNELFGVSKEE